MQFLVAYPLSAAMIGKKLKDHHEQQMLLREMKKAKTVKGRLKLATQAKVGAKVAPIIKQRAMSIMGDVSDDYDSDGEEDLAQYQKKKEDKEIKKAEKEI